MRPLNYLPKAPAVNPIRIEDALRRLKHLGRAVPELSHAEALEAARYIWYQKHLKVITTS